ncbi:MAG TPA: PhoX family phosphatase [Gammaproteobacteria bacterium]|nr:PhoX family phosphatase [Gammaproteobacteria bacterium]
MGKHPATRNAARAFEDIVAARTSRRTVLRGGLATAVTGFLGGTLTACDTEAPAPPNATTGPASQPRLGFAAVPIGTADEIVVPPGYRYQVLLPWGEPILGDYPEFRLENTGAEQAMQIGMHHDGMHFFPIEGEHPYEGSSDDGLLVMNHEYVEPRLLHAVAAGTEIGSFVSPVDEDGSRDPDQVLKEINAHGVSVTRIRRGEDGRWAAVRDPRNRRVTAQTPMAIAGPVRGHDSVRTQYSPEGLMTRGTMANCAHGVTPWNTYLTCEENWWYYFAAAENEERPSFTRYRVGSILPWNWHLARGGADEHIRFNAVPTGATAAEDYRNEPHCVGWIVEIDPFDPDSTPVKRTHLGRCSHEAVVFAPVREGEPVVVYTGDDAGGQFIYKFVSARPYRAATADGSLLDEGTLYAARFDEDGSGEWLALVPGENAITAEAGYPDLASVLIDPRGAAELAGATRMDRPEWGAVDPVTGDVYFTLTNNAGRTETHAANPRERNVYGHIIRWREAGGDPAGTRFDWDLFALGGDEANGRDANGEPLTADSMFGCPDGLWIDPDRRLWIQTDAPDASGDAYAALGNNMMLAADPDTGEIRRFLTGPIGQEITGVIATPDQTTMFVNVQHPGAGATSAEAFARGEHASRWPDGGTSYPRSATVAITKDDGGRIGS